MTRFHLILYHTTVLLLALCSTILAASSAGHGELRQRQASTPRMVFCHFMIGIVADRTSSADYDSDMQRAKDLGIDAFALNIGVNSYTETQLNYAFKSAADNNMKVFISFDFNWYHAGSDAARIGQLIANYAGQPAQVKISNKVFVSSFAGDGLDVKTMRSSAGVDVFWAPNYHPEQSKLEDVDGALNWMAWDNNGANKAPSVGENVTVADGDASYNKWLSGKPYIAPVSPWFSTHFGPEVSYSKNWVFPSDDLWFRRWNEILVMKPQFLEIVTWNDYGESHHIGPLSSKHNDDGCSKWVNEMTHGGWMDMAKPFIAVYKAGASSADSYIKSDQLIYWYRPSPREANCDATDTTMVPAGNDSGNYFQGRPDGFHLMADSAFVVTLLTSPAKVTALSGGNSQIFNAPAGASIFSVPMGVGQQKFSLSRDSATVLSGTSLKDVVWGCICGLYNFNAYVGTIPEGSRDVLAADGLRLFGQGLKGACVAQPSLGGNSTKPNSTLSQSVTARPTSTRFSNPTSPVTPSVTPGTSRTVSTASPPAVTNTTNPVHITVAPISGTPRGMASDTPSGTPSKSCVAGTVAPGWSGNYLGLCSFACGYGYCPPGPCVCMSYNVAITAPATVGTLGWALPGLGDSYKGLCAFACHRGYCPETGCTRC